MRAACLVGPSRCEVREVPDPVAPVGGLLLQVQACGLCGSDLRRWKEGPPPGVEGIVPGHEVAGVVLEVGQGCTDYRPGDRLALAPDVHCGRCYYCRHGWYNLCDDLHLVGVTPGYPGGLTQRMALTPEILINGIVHRLPAELSFVEGTLAEPLASVLAAHQKTRTNLEDVVVVLGAGPIGCLHIAIAKAQGAYVILSQTSARRRELARRFNPDVIIDPTQEDLVARVRALTEGRGADIVICANAVGATQTQAVQLARKGGQVVLFGGLPKANPMVTLDANRIHYGEIEVLGAFSYHPAMHALALDVLRRKLIPADRLVTHTFPLEQVGEAFGIAVSGGGLKVVIAMQDTGTPPLKGKQDDRIE